MRNSSTICADASVIVRLVAPSPESTVPALWRQWQSEHRTIVAPTLLRYEVTNAIHRMRIAGIAESGLAEDLLATALRLPITLYDDSYISRHAFALATRFALKAAYDTHYLALSEHLGCELWTADRRFFNAVHDQCDWVRLADGS